MGLAFFTLLRVRSLPLRNLIQDGFKVSDTGCRRSFSLYSGDRDI